MATTIDKPTAEELLARARARALRPDAAAENAGRMQFDLALKPPFI